MQKVVKFQSVSRSLEEQATTNQTNLVYNPEWMLIALKAENCLNYNSKLGGLNKFPLGASSSKSFMASILNGPSLGTRSSQWWEPHLPKTSEMAKVHSERQRSFNLQSFEYHGSHGSIIGFPNDGSTQASFNCHLALRHAKANAAEACRAGMPVMRSINVASPQGTTNPFKNL